MNRIKKELMKMKDYPKLEQWLVDPLKAFKSRGNWYHVAFTEEDDDALLVVCYKICKDDIQRTAIVNKRDYIQWATERGYTELVSDRVDESGEHVQVSFICDGDDWLEEYGSNQNMLAAYLLENEPEWQINVIGQPLYNFLNDLFGRAAL